MVWMVVRIVGVIVRAITVVVIIVYIGKNIGGEHQTPVSQTSVGGEDQTPVSQTSVGGEDQTPVSQTSVGGEDQTPVGRKHPAQRTTPNNALLRGQSAQVRFVLSLAL